MILVDNPRYKRVSYHDHGITRLWAVWSRMDRGFLLTNERIVR
jgi:hypothetical protein